MILNHQNYCFNLNWEANWLLVILDFLYHFIFVVSGCSSSFLIFYSLFHFFFSYFECFKICGKCLKTFLLFLQYCRLFEHIYCISSGCWKVTGKEYLLFWAFTSNIFFFKLYVKVISPLMLFLLTPLCSLALSMSLLVSFGMTEIITARR